jgi:hypothetical protein
MILTFYILFVALGACNLLFVILIWMLMKEPVVVCSECVKGERVSATGSKSGGRK